MSYLIEGIDCAKDIMKRGVAFAKYAHSECSLDTVDVGLNNGDSFMEKISVTNCSIGWCRLI